MRSFAIKALILVFSLSAVAMTGRTNQPAPAGPRSTHPALLKPADLGNILPGTVFFRGQSAPVQIRNSSGLRFEDNSLTLFSLVDTSGYSSQVQEKYQAYLITESALDIDGHRLAAGAYGCGFLANGTFIVMDLGGHDLFAAHTARDNDLHRPTPLQIMAAPSEPGKYRLYAGRSYVEFARAPAN